MNIKNKRPSPLMKYAGLPIGSGNPKYLLVLAAGFLTAFAVMLPYIIYA